MKRSLQGDSCRLYYLGHPGIVSLDRFGKSLRGIAVIYKSEIGYTRLDVCVLERFNGFLV